MTLSLTLTSTLSPTLVPTLSGGGGTPDPTADWAAWSGANDGANTNLFTTNGFIRGQDQAAVNDSEAVLTYRDGTTEEWRAVVLDVADKAFLPEDTNTEIVLTGTIPLAMHCVRLTETRFLICCNTEDDFRIALVGKSGKTLTILDEELLETGFSFQNDVARLTDTKAVLHYRNTLVSNYSHVMVIDVTGDTITTGTPLSLGINSSDIATQYCGVTKALVDGSAFWACNRRRVYYCTISGTTITKEAFESIDAINTQFNDTMCEYVDENAMIVTHEVGATRVDATSFTWSGSAIVREDAVTDIFDGNNIFQGTGCSTGVGARQAMFSGRMDDETPQVSGQVVLSLNESNDIVVGDLVFTSNFTSDHNTIDATPSQLYVFLCIQNEGETPNQMVGTKVLQGF